MNRIQIAFFVVSLIGLSTVAVASIRSYPDNKRQDKQTPNQSKRLAKKLKPLHKPMGEPQPGDWLTRHKEPGQTLLQYLRGKPVRPTEQRNVLYVQQIGDFSEKQQEVFELTVEFMTHYFGTEVKLLDPLSLDAIPDKAKRVHPNWGDDQVLTSYVLEDVLYPNIPDDGWALLGLTSSDLWPGDGWNFVFGQASLTNRVGVWSIYRNGDPAEGDDEFKTCLLRTLKTATHETGHMLSMQHCIYYECNMCGSNSQRESDRRPVYLCPVCTAKITWATQTSPLTRAKKLKEFCDTNGLTDESKYYERVIKTLEPEE